VDAERGEGPLSERELQIRTVLASYDDYEDPMAYFQDISRILHGE
jgi:hypothetical protein